MPNQYLLPGFLIIISYSYFYAMTTGRENTTIITRLTALWALCESGLGGWMHALKLPFTGIFIGGFAVIIISLIAHYSKNSFRQILLSTLIVILIKTSAGGTFKLAPNLAVAFQGVMGAVLYNLISNFSLASILFGAIAMLESALQKLIFMTLIFGKSLWEALDALFEGIVKDFSLSAGFSFSFWLIGIYTGMYVLWGFLLGIWISRLPRKINDKSASIRTQYQEFTPLNSSMAVGDKKNGKRRKILFLLFTLLFITSVFLLQGHNLNKALYVVLRTIAVTLLLFGVVSPVLTWLVQQWLNKSRSKYTEAMQPVVALLPEMRNSVQPAYQLAKRQHSNWRRYPAFLLTLIIITLHPPNER